MSDQIRDPEDRFSHNEAQILLMIGREYSKSRISHDEAQILSKHVRSITYTFERKEKEQQHL